MHPWIQLGILIYFLCVSSVYSKGEIKQAKFYDGTDFQGLIWQGQPGKSCISLPYYGRQKSSSIITSTCLMVFSTQSCNFGSPSFVLQPGNHPDLSKISHSTQSANDIIWSFRECKEDEGGNSVHIQLYSGSYYDYSNTLVEYFNMIECTNLPLYSFSQVNRVHNHGNCVKLFNSTDCIGNSVTIQAGISADSEFLYTLNFDGKTQSISPCKIDE